MSPRRCPLGYLIAADSTCCRRHEGLTPCRACSQPLDLALVTAGIGLHANCRDPDNAADPRSNNERKDA